MERKRIAFHTLGCKLNFAETSGLAKEMKDECQLVDFNEAADYYVIQSCAVTATAEKKCKNAIRQAHKRNPEANIIVLGCMSQLRANMLAEIEGVSLVLGNAEKFHLKAIIQQEDEGMQNTVLVSNILKDKKFHASVSGSDRTRTFVKIQDGCDYFCTFCTIPLARGRSRSNNIKETINLIYTALKDNPREIVLTGVNIGDFGKQWKESLYDLLLKIETIDAHVRFRLSSIEPDLLNDEIIRLVAGSVKFMPHFHIPLQSGSDTILKRMNRRYTTEVFQSRVNLIKRLMPFACIAADVIIGFPGETEEEFEQTYNLVQSLPISYLHVFPYSERPGTMANKMTDKIKPEVIQRRVKALMQLSDIKKHSFLLSNKGRIEEVLFETENHNGYISGFTRNYIKVKAPFKQNFINTVFETRLCNLADDESFLFQQASNDSEYHQTSVPVNEH